MRAIEAPPAVAISVVVCAYTIERWPLLVRAVESVLDQSRPPLELIIVIDHNDELYDAAHSAFPAARVLANAEPRGLSGARNTGWMAAQGDVVAFLDDDAVAARNWLENITDDYIDPSVAGVGGLILPDWAGEPPKFLPEEFWWVVGCTYKGVPTERAEVRNMLGANMSLRRSVLLDVGGFNTGLGRVGKHPVGCEETELCIRIQAAEPTATIINDPTAVVHHFVPPERATWRYFRARCFAEGRSKAFVAKLQGSKRGLSTERSYVACTLTRGLVANTRTAIAGRDVGAATRTASIVIGLAWTSAGYLSGVVIEVLREVTRRRVSARTGRPI